MNKISSNHMFFIVLGLSLISLRAYPTILFKVSRNDTWISLIISSVILLLFTYLIYKACIKQNCFSLKQIYLVTAGKYLGTLLFILLIFTLYLTLIECCSVCANSIQLNFLYHTPSWFISLFILIPALYSITKGEKSILIVSIIGISLVLSASIILLLLSAKYNKFSNLLPILSKGITLNLLISTIKSLGLFGFVLLSIPFAENLLQKNKLMKSILFSVLLTAIIIISSIIGIIASFGGNLSAEITYPKLIQIQQISYLSFVENGEVLAIMQLILSWYIKYILVFLALLKILELSKKKSHSIPVFISIIVAIPAMYLSKNLFQIYYFLNAFSYFCFLNLFMVPLIIFSFFYSKKLGIVTKISEKL